jgi:hypothetical protein
MSGKVLCKDRSGWVMFWLVQDVLGYFKIGQVNSGQVNLGQVITDYVRLLQVISG